MESNIPILDMALRLAVGAGLALFVGLERELRGKPAGLRSHMLVALGSAAFIIMGFDVLYGIPDSDATAKLDPTRIIQGVIGGIGFLGAGSIIRSGGEIRGITTGASIWLAGSIGVAAGIHNFPLAIMITVLALIIMSAMGHFERCVIAEHKADND
ncbi:MAG: MgtC/SapB family protein [Idiomarina sp.]